MSEIFHTILYQPLFNLLVALYNIVPGHDVGVAIILLTLFIKVVFYPLTAKMLTSQRKMQELQPRIKEIQEKYKHDKMQQTQETMKLYQDYGVHPLGGCLPLLVQLPLLLALFQVFRTGFDTASLSNLYSFVENPGELDPWFFGLVNLSESSLVLSLLAGASQFLHTYLITKGQAHGVSDSEFGKAMQRQTLYIMPILTAIISFTLPAALPFYWFANTVFSIGEHYLSLRSSS